MVQSDHPLRRWRDAKSVTLVQLGTAVGVSASHLSEIERWANTPSLQLAATLSRATGGLVKIEEFVK